MDRYTKKPELAQTTTIEEIPAACASEPKAVEFFEAKRWGSCPCCPRCGSVDVYQMKDRATGERNARYLWRCRDCKRQYTVRTGTVFEESLIPLHKWARAYWEAASCKNGVSALELSRKIQVSYKTALFMMHRIRWAMADDHASPPQLTGIVEADETYVGGKPRHRGWNHGRQVQPRTKWTTKTPVVAMVQRGGVVRAQVVPNVTAGNLVAVLQENVDPSATLMTDESNRYRQAGKPFGGRHYRVNHSRGEYARGDVTTNRVEGFFSRVKRSLNGTYHAVSKQHLHRYIAQAEFAYNTRRLTDGDRVVALIQRSMGKRLMYREPSAE